MDAFEFGEMAPEELEKHQQLIERAMTEAVRLAATMRHAELAQQEGNKPVAQMYAFAVSTVLGMKTHEELLTLVTASLKINAMAAESMAKAMATDAVSGLEKMLREAES